ncbi:MAG: hypothetical protein AAGJ19_03370 [Myxococcota bacterium]
MSWALALLVAAQPEIIGFDYRHDPERVVFILEGNTPPSFSAQHDAKEQRLVIDWAGARLRPGLAPPLHPWLRTVRLLERRVESEHAVRIVIGLGTARSFQLRARKNQVQIVFPGPPPSMPEDVPEQRVKLDVAREAKVEVPTASPDDAPSIPNFEDEAAPLEIELPPIDTTPEVEAALARAAEAERLEREAAERREAREKAETERLARLQAQKAAEAEERARAERAEAEALAQAERARIDADKRRREAAASAERAAAKSESSAASVEAPLATWSPPAPEVLASTAPEPAPQFMSEPAQQPSRTVPPDQGPPPSELDMARARPERPAIRLPVERSTMSYIGFRMRGRISRVFVRLDRDVGFETEQQPGKLLLILPGTRVDVPNNERPLDTSYFESPVTWVKASSEPERTVVEIRLRSSVPWMSKKIGTTLAIDFVRPE